MVGGWTSGGFTDLTETLSEGSSAWTTHSPHWTGLADGRLITYNNIPLLFGGNIGAALAGYERKTVADILVWDDETSTWAKTGEMLEPRKFHGVSAIELDLATINACKTSL